MTSVTQQVIATILIDSMPEPDIADRARAQQTAARIVEATGLDVLMALYEFVQALEKAYSSWPKELRDGWVGGRLTQAVTIARQGMRGVE